MSKNVTVTNNKPVLKSDKDDAPAKTSENYNTGITFTVVPGYENTYGSLNTMAISTKSYETLENQWRVSTLNVNKEETKRALDESKNAKLYVRIFVGSNMR